MTWAVSMTGSGRGRSWEEEIRPLALGAEQREGAINCMSPQNSYVEI